MTAIETNAVGAVKVKLTGTPNQVEWAEQIRRTVEEEFDRVAQVLHAHLSVQTGQKHAEMCVIMTVLEEKRAETMSIEVASYFIREWRELSDQVRQMIAKDLRYQAIRDRRATRRRTDV